MRHMVWMFGLLCAVLLLGVSVGCAAQGQNYERRETEINAHYVPLVEKDPNNAELYFRWGQALDKLAWRAGLSYKISAIDTQPIQERANARLAQAFALQPQNPRFARELAVSRMTFLEHEQPTEGVSAPSYVAAQEAYTRAERLNPKNWHLMRCWTITLDFLAAAKRTPPDDALVMLKESDRVYAILVARGPEEAKKGMDNPWYWSKRGEAAVIAAWRTEDPAQAAGWLRRAREHFTKAVALEGEEPILIYSDWTWALDTRDKPLRVPAFAETMHREQLAVFREKYQGKKSGSTENDLCLSLERVAGYAGTPDEQSAMLREARLYCEEALKSPYKGDHGHMREAIARIDAKLGAVRQ